MATINIHDILQKRKYRKEKERYNSYEESSGEEEEERSGEEKQITLKDLSRDDIRELILKELMSWKDTPSRQYLMQCAEWRPTDYCDPYSWIAYSPISDWPLYDLGGLQYTDDEDAIIEFHSWKADFRPQKCRQQYGNLLYTGPRRYFTGRVWTRGL